MPQPAPPYRGEPPEGAAMSSELARRFNGPHSLVYAVRQRDRIIKAAADAMCLEPEPLLGRSRRSRVVIARFVAMALIRERLGWTFERIGRHFDRRDHSAVIYGCRRVAECEPGDAIHIVHQEALRRLDGGQE